MEIKGARVAFLTFEDNGLFGFQSLVVVSSTESIQASSIELMVSIDPLGRRSVLECEERRTGNSGFRRVLAIERMRTDGQ